ncbi:MAG: MFS transporter [Clostridiales Family XIII bacterium]|jgi:MFS family permease|nr:MFS transporter [Clostridiales Family XIII bacterium]
MNDTAARFWNKPYVLLLLVNTIAYLAFQALAPLLPVYATRFDATESQIGFLAASVSLAALLIRPVSGLLADRGNSKHIILITQFMAVGIVASFIIAPNISVLIALRFFHGFLFGISSTVVMTAVVRVIPEAQMGRGIGLLSVTSIGSQAVAPALGIELSGRWGYPALFSAASGIAGIAGFLAFVLKAQPAPKTGTDTAKRKISRKDMFAVEALGLTVLVIFFTATPSTITNFLVVFGNDRDIGGIGYYFTIYAAVLIGVRSFCGGLIDRYPYRRIVYVCTALCIAGLVLVGAARSFAPLAAAAVLLGVGYGIVLPALQTAIVRSVPEERRGVAGATFYIGMDAGYVAGSVAMGFIAEAFGYAAGFFALCVPLLAVIPLTLGCVEADRRREIRRNI